VRLPGEAPDAGLKERSLSFSTHALQNLLDTWSYPAVFLFVGIESTGIPFPGETMLITAAVYAGAGHLNIALVIAFAAAGAILGDNLGYLLGRRGGRPLALKYGRYVRVDERKLDAAERFFEAHGDKTVFIGRWIAVLRTWAAILAGLNRMHWPRFLVFNAAGGITWATFYGLLAYALGKNLPLLDRVVRIFGIVGIVLAVAFVVVIYVLYRRGMLFRHRQDPDPPDQEIAQ
jgi:membrane protein DedA with SNARE-associated domain